MDGSTLFASEQLPEFDCMSPHLSSLLINTWQIYSRDKLDGRRKIGVVITAVDVDTVDTILMGTLCGVESASLAIPEGLLLATYVRRSQDCTVPVGHHQIVSIC